jgi:hypothetical protein
LDKPKPLKHQWRPLELLVHEHRLPADIYWCLGDAFFFSRTAQASVIDVMAEDVEWLPVPISGLGDFYVLHPLREVPLAPKASVEINSVSRNITVIRKHEFQSEDLGDLRVFMPAQARGSAAAQAGFSFGQVMITDVVQRCIVERGLVGVRCHEAHQSRPNICMQRTRRLRFVLMLNVYWRRVADALH